MESPTQKSSLVCPRKPRSPASRDRPLPFVVLIKGQSASAEVDLYSHITWVPVELTILIPIPFPRILQDLDLKDVGRKAAIMNYNCGLQTVRV